MEKQNLILITLDAVRPDHFSCYGYNRFKSQYVDEIAAEGVLFENCICSSCLTPVSHATILTGKHPNKHGVRHPFSKVKAKMLSEMLKEHGYNTAGFVGINFLSSKHGFSKGFDYFNEPTDETSWNTKEYRKGDKSMKTLWGNWWIPDMLDWMKQYAHNPFFIWTHYFEVHFLSEKWLMNSGRMKNDEMSDWAYYDAKLKYMDEHFIGAMNRQLKKLGIWEDTTIVLTSDHGETLGPNHPTWEDFYFNYPQHKTMTDDDLKVPLIVKSKSLPKNKRIKHTVSAVDLVPTVLDILGIKEEIPFDGVSLMPLFRNESIEERITYSEELYEERGKGSLQCVRSSRYKLIRNITEDIQEFYDLQNDPNEQSNLINQLTPQQAGIVEKFRRIMDEYYKGFNTIDEDFTEEESRKIEERLRDLGYI